MASLREYRQKIKSVKSTQQITKAMKMVAAARLRKAQQRIISARPFAIKMEETMRDLLGRVSGEEDHPLFMKRDGLKRLLILATSDKGLCGAYNTNLIREALKYLRQHGPQNVMLIIVGRKGRDYFRRIHSSVLKEYVQIFQNLSFAQAELITQDVLEAYRNASWTAVDMMYSEFKSVVSQRVVLKPLLPLIPVTSPENGSRFDFIYEPKKEDLLQAIVLRFLRSQVYRMLLEGAASELGARMSAMDNATRNASELLDSLKLQMNRTRQASITKEILEIVSGAEALK